jgi:hypothetical protein
MAAKQAAPTAMQMAQANAQARAALLATAPRFVKNMGVSTSGVGLSTRQKLFNVGILTKLLLYCQCGVTIGTATATPSGKAPYNLISRIRVTDYDNTDRVNISGFQLFVLNSVRWRNPYGYANGYNAYTVPTSFTNPNVPTAVATATLSFFIEVPLAYDVDNQYVQAQDLRGSIMAQTAVGEMYATIDWCTSLYANGDVESLYSGGATSTVVGSPTNATCITVQIWQEFLLPQAIGGQGQIPLPPIDLQTVYELSGNVRSTDNIAQNNEKLFNFPNVRSCIGAYYNFVSGGQLQNGNTANGVSWRLIVNGNAIVEDDTYFSQLFRQRRFISMEGDLQLGVYFKPYRVRPIETWLFGNVQAGGTPQFSPAGGNQYFEVMYESFYTKGAALPGLIQAG